MKNGNANKSSRRRFIAWSAGTIAALATVKLLFVRPKKKTVKMLTRDGKLVEVDVSKISGNTKKKKISDGEIHTWISKQ